MQNQCAASAYALRDVPAPLWGLYGACSTMSESLCLGALLVGAGYFASAACATGSHFCSAERQFRYPLEYGSVRAPTAQWTVTGAGCVVLAAEGPSYGNYYAAWRACERLYKEGLIRAIGVTSFSNERLQDLFLHNEVKPAVNQLETHPFFQQQAANKFLQCEGIQHEAWAPFAEGQNDIWNNSVLKAIAEKHGRTVGQVVLRWLNQRNVVVIPKTVHKERMVENFNILDFTLTEKEMDAIAMLETGKSPIYDDMDLATVKGIGLHKIHD